MKGRKYNLERRAAVRFIALVVIVTMLTGCNDPLLQQTQPGTPATGGVPVSVSIGLADGDEFTATPSTRSAAKGAMEVELQSAAATRAGTDYKPDKLYYLEVQQYKQDGTRLQNNILANTAITVGSLLELTLTPTVNDEYCQLVIVARGSTGMMPTLKDKNLSDVQQNISVTAANINSIAYTADDIKMMPYVLHLKQVKVTNVGGKFVIQSPEGAFDTRLLLKRLAARLNVTWDYRVTGYALNQLWIQDIPLNYSVVDAPDEQGSYPSLVSQFTTLQVLVTSQSGTYSCWVPANVRGERAEASSDVLRTKANAPQGSSYFNFIATHTSDTRKKLYYRVYIGNGLPKDFNLNRNKDYVYRVNFNHQGIPTNDGRVTYIDPIPASQNNDNLVPTANCFMVEPGGAFCFDPFLYQVKKNTDNVNVTLKGWSDSEGGIASVKMLWQTRENGDVGDPVLGVVNATDDHSNVVAIKKNDGTEVLSLSPLTAAGQGRIYCRIAANTSGGNGMIAAYNRNGEVIWSWHIWVTDYKPDATGNVSVGEPAKRKLKFTHNVTNQLPMMDRNLGAMAGYVNEVPPTELEKSKTNGLMYQFGRKEPFASSFSSEPISIIPDISGDKPVKGMLNRYGPDGLTYVKEDRFTASDLRTAYKYPEKKANGSGWWTSDGGRDNLWGGTANATKTVYDPCPAGWKVAPNSSFNSFFYAQDYAGTSNPNVSNMATIRADGGFLCYYNGAKSGDRVYIRLTGYALPGGGFKFIGQRLAYWMSGAAHAFIVLLNDNLTQLSEFKTSTGSACSDGNSLRCIQEQE